MLLGAWAGWTFVMPCDSHRLAACPQDAWYASSRPSDSDEEATLLPIHVRLERGHFDKDLPAQSRDSNAGTATVTHASLSSKVVRIEPCGCRPEK